MIKHKPRNLEFILRENIFHKQRKYTFGHIKIKIFHHEQAYSIWYIEILKAKQYQIGMKIYKYKIKNTGYG